MITAIRVELDEDHGIINNSFRVKHRKHFQQMMKRHHQMITLDEIALPLPIENYRCAYKSIEDLQKYVTLQELKYLKVGGLKIYQLELSDSAIIEVDQIVYQLKDIKSKIDITNKIIQSWPT